MGQPQPDQRCLEVPFVTSSLKCDALNVGETVSFASGE